MDSVSQMALGAMAIGQGFEWLGLRLLDANTPPLHRQLAPATGTLD